MKMKVFEKWRDKQKISGRSYKADARVWRAALEEVLKQTKRTNRGRVGIIDWIEEELKED